MYRIKSLSVSLLLSVTAIVQGQSIGWNQYVNPAEAGFSAEGLSKVDEQLSQMSLPAVMVVHHGNVVYSSGNLSRRFMCHSVRKSIMSAMYGIYEDQGDIALNSTLKSLGIDDKEGLTETEKQATILNLLTSKSGIYHPAAYEPRGMSESRPERGSAKPGEQFFYNNWDFNVLLTIIEQEAHINFFEAVKQRITDPIGMEDFRLEDTEYRFDPESEHAAYLFKLSTRDLARFGQLYLQKGQWNGVQIIPEDWVDRSTKAFATNLPGFEGRGGYGMLWWVDDHGFSEPCYYASGLGGHRVYVFPESDIVIVTRANTYLFQFESSEKIDALVQLVLDAKSSSGMANPLIEPLSELVIQHQITGETNVDFKRYLGTYNHRFFGEINAVEINGQPYLKGKILGSFRVFAQSDDTFSIEDIPEFPLVFAPSNEEHGQGEAITEMNAQRRPERMVLYY